MSIPKAFGVDNLTFAPAPHREKNACVCCSDGAEVVIHANNYQDDHRVIPANDPDSNKGIVTRCCHLFTKLCCRPNVEEKAAKKIVLQQEQDRKAYEILSRDIVNRFGPEIADLILPKQEGPLLGKTVKDVVTEAERHQLQQLAERPVDALVKKEGISREESTSSKSPSTTKRNNASKFWSKYTQAPVTVIRPSLGDDTVDISPFDPAKIAAILSHATAASLSQIAEITQEVSQEVTTKQLPNGLIATTTINKIVYTKIVDRNISIIPPSTPTNRRTSPNQRSHLELTQTASIEELN